MRIARIAGNKPPRNPSECDGNRKRDGRGCDLQLIDESRAVVLIDIDPSTNRTPAVSGAA